MPKTNAEVQNNINKAVIAILNGMRLRDADILYGDGSNASYGRIRGALIRFCIERNPEKANQLRESDASRKMLKKTNKKTREYGSADVSYQSLQNARHHFLTPHEISDFNAYMEIESGESMKDLIAKRVKYEKALSQITATSRSLGTITRSSAIEICILAERIDENQTAIEGEIDLAQALATLSDVAKRTQTLDSIRDHELRAKTAY